MRKLAFAAIITTFLTACGPLTQNPNVNPTPVPTPDLNGRFVEVPANQPFKYSVVAAGLVVIRRGGVQPVLPNPGPTYNNLRAIVDAATDRVLVTYDGYVQPDENTQLIVKTLAQGKTSNPSRGPYSVFFNRFTSAGIELSVRDPSTNIGLLNAESVQLMVEISQFKRN